MLTCGAWAETVELTGEEVTAPCGRLPAEESGAWEEVTAAADGEGVTAMGTGSVTRLQSAAHPWLEMEEAAGGQRFHCRYHRRGRPRPALGALFLRACLPLPLAVTKGQPLLTSDDRAAGCFRPFPRAGDAQ